MIFNTILDL